MAQVGRRGSKIESGTGFQADISEIIESLNQMDLIPSEVLGEAAVLIGEMGKELLNSEFEYAMEQQSEVALPYEFRDHIRDVVNNAQFITNLGGKEFQVEFDFNQLGTVQDLKRAFHQGARTADGDVIDGPYEGEELENPVGERHLYWQAMAEGKDKAPTSKTQGGSIRIKEGAWQETKEKYIQIWGDKAPQWLYLQFGQQKWEPRITPSTIIEDFTYTFTQRAGEIFNEVVTTAIEQAQGYYVSTDYGSRLNKGIDELGPSGKPRRAGQFYFRR